MDVAILIHQQIAFQVAHAAQNLREFALREPECLLEQDRLEVVHVLNRTHCPGALAWQMQQHLQKPTCTQGGNDACAKALALEHQQQMWEVPLTARQHERGHELVRGAVQHEE